MGEVMVKFDKKKKAEYKATILKYIDVDFIESAKGKKSLVTQKYLENLTEEKLYEWIEYIIEDYIKSNCENDNLKFIIACTIASLEEPYTRLYHGSPIGEIDTLEPRESNHGKKYVYTTDNFALAVLYSYNPIERPGGFYTYRFDKDNNLIYDEYFPNQLEKMYKGHEGYVYEVSKTQYFQPMEKMSWIYVSTRKTKVLSPTHIPDIYEEILKLEKQGQIVINRYENMTETEREKWRSIVIKDIEMKELKDDKDSSYAQFLHENFPDLI